MSNMQILTDESVHDINMKRRLAPLLLNRSWRGTSSGLLWLSSCLLEVWELLFFGLCPSFSLRFSKRPQAKITVHILRLITFLFFHLIFFLTVKLSVGWRLGSQTAVGRVLPNRLLAALRRRLRFEAAVAQLGLEDAGWGKVRCCACWVSRWLRKVREDFYQFHAAAAAAVVPVQQYPVISAQPSGGKSPEITKDTAEADTQGLCI